MDDNASARIERRLKNAEIAVASAYEQVNIFIRQALTDVSFEIGGDELSKEITELAGSAFPESAAFERLEQIAPGSANYVLERASQIQETNNRQEIIEARSIKALGRAILWGVGAIGAGLSGNHRYFRHRRNR